MIIWRRASLFLACLAPLFLAACGSAPLTVAPSGLSASGTVVVRPGDTVYAIARRYGVSQRDLIDRNALRPPYILQVGQTLSIATPRIHVVRSGDTVSEIAERYGVSQRELIARNGLRPPYVIQVGDRLSLPSGQPVRRSSPPVVTARAPQPVPAQPAPRTAPRQPGQPWSGGGTLNFPVTGNGLPAPSDSQTTGVGQAGSPPLPVDRPAGTSGSTSPAPAIVTPAPAPTRTVQASSPARRTGDTLSPPPRSGRFLWPVEGRVIGGFGPREGGLHNDGINIAAPAGTPIRAAENGVVVYAGNQLQGFGNLLLIKHADGWVTAYAHAAELRVDRGDQVDKGAVIATVGQTGNVTRPQLHFEIRRGQQAIDPRKELPSTQTSSVKAKTEPAA